MMGFVMAAFAASSPPAETAPIERLDWMIGEWRFADAAVDTDAHYEEVGGRSCAYALDRRYIRCDNVGAAGGEARHYVMYFAYNERDERYELFSLWGNLAGYGHRVGELSADGRRLEIRDPAPRVYGSNAPRIGWSVLEYDGSGTWTWGTGWMSDADSDPGPVRFRDQAIRIETAE